MWGSDYPFIVDDPGYASTRALVEHHFAHLSADERAAIGGGTCTRLFDFRVGAGPT